MKPLHRVQDEIVAKILVAMDLEWLRGSRAGTLLEIAKGDIETLSMLIEAEDEFVKFSPSSVARTEEIAHRLLEKNPNSVPGLRWLVWVNWYQVSFSFPARSSASIRMTWDPSDHDDVSIS